MSHRTGPVKRRSPSAEAAPQHAADGRGRARGVLARVSSGALGRLRRYDVPEADGEPLFAKDKRASAKPRKSPRA